jgi:dTDP-4-dehydrorhamnose reductase
MNSRLDCAKAKSALGVALPDWREGVADCVARLLGKA